MWHDGIIYKMISLGMDTTLIRLIQSYLVDRIFFIRVGEAHSSTRPVLTGVPQDSMLGPELFIQYVYDPDTLR